MNDFFCRANAERGKRFFMKNLLKVLPTSLSQQIINFPSESCFGFLRSGEKVSECLIKTKIFSLCTLCSDCMQAPEYRHTLPHTLNAHIPLLPIFKFNLKCIKHRERKIVFPSFSSLAYSCLLLWLRGPQRIDTRPETTNNI